MYPTLGSRTGEPDIRDARWHFDSGGLSFFGDRTRISMHENEHLIEGQFIVVVIGLRRNEEFQDEPISVTRRSNWMLFNAFNGGQP